MKHILNDLTEQEKNSIREQHTGGMKVMTESFSKLLNSKLGDVKPILEQSTTGNTPTVFGAYENLTEIAYEAIKHLVNSLPLMTVYSMLKSAINGDAKTFNQILDQEKSRLGSHYTTLKNAVTKGEISKIAKMIGDSIKPQTDVVDDKKYYPSGAVR